MNAWMGLQLEWQIVIVFIIGFMLGPMINWAIYNLAYFPRPISPWWRSRFRVCVEKGAEAEYEKLVSSTAKYGMVHIPIMGWLFLRPDSSTHGKLFWLRPCLIELLFPCFLGWLFWYEVTGGLLPALALPPAARIQPSLHLQFFAHSVLCCFMCVATFIDFDERTIPDVITIPATLLGLIGAICFSNWHLWTSIVDPATNAWPSTLHYDSPWWFSVWTGTKGLSIGLAAYSIWCFALADRRLILRRGWRKAIVYFLAGLIRFPTWKYLVGIWLVGSIAISIAWQMLTPMGQQSLLSSLLGILIGGMTVWMIRCIAGLAIGVEALGFGDVTLMAMVGAYLGWQPTAIAFFISPMIALVFVLIRYVVTGDNQTPFGPYLCVGVLVTFLFWDKIWNGYFQDMLLVMGSVLGPLALAFLVLTFILLWFWRLIKGLVFS